MEYWLRKEFLLSFDPLNNAFFCWKVETQKKVLELLNWRRGKNPFFTQSPAKSIKIEDIKYQSVFLPFIRPHTSLSSCQHFEFFLPKTKPCKPWDYIVISYYSSAIQLQTCRKPLQDVAKMSIHVHLYAIC